MKKEPLNPAVELLKDELEHRGISKAEAARCMNIPPSRLTDIIHGRKRFSYDTALRLEHYLGADASLWMNLQLDHELRIARKEKEAETRKIKLERPLQQAAPQSA